MAAIGGFRSGLSITRKTDENFGNVIKRGCFVFQSRVSINENNGKLHLIASLNNCIQRGLQIFLAKSWHWLEDS